VRVERWESGYGSEEVLGIVKRCPFFGSSSGEATNVPCVDPVH
jgi:hypothetical protein